MPDIALLSLLGGVLGATFALACGGWVAARAAGAGSSGAAYGFLVGATTILLLLALAVPPLQRVIDVQSVAIELGLVAPPGGIVPVPDQSDRPGRPATAVPDSAPPDALVAAFAHVRATAWYTLAALSALLGGAVLGGIAGEPSPYRARSTPGMALTSLAGTMALLAVLTVWLWPSVRVTGLAFADMDQSAGPDVGVNLTEVARHPEAMWNRTVTISGSVHRLLGPRALLLGDDAPFVGDIVLVVAGEPLATFVTGGGTLEVGEVAQVTGVVQPLSSIEPERLLPGLAGYTGEAALVAQKISLDIPVAAAHGDKEFPEGTDGPEGRISINDLLDDPDRYVGEVVTVSGEVEEGLLTPHAFLLSDHGLLVVSAEPRPEVFVEATAYVTGEVRRFDRAALERELGIVLPGREYAPFAGQPVIVVASLRLVT